MSNLLEKSNVYSVQKPDGRRITTWLNEQENVEEEFIINTSIQDPRKPYFTYRREFKYDNGPNQLTKLDFIPMAEQLHNYPGFIVSSSSNSLRTEPWKIAIPFGSRKDERHLQNTLMVVNDVGTIAFTPNKPSTDMPVFGNAYFQDNKLQLNRFYWTENQCFAFSIDQVKEKVAIRLREKNYATQNQDNLTEISFLHPSAMNAISSLEDFDNFLLNPYNQLYPHPKSRDITAYNLELLNLINTLGFQTKMQRTNFDSRANLSLPSQAI